MSDDLQNDKDLDEEETDLSDDKGDLFDMDEDELAEILGEDLKDEDEDGILDPDEIVDEEEIDDLLEPDEDVFDNEENDGFGSGKVDDEEDSDMF